MLPCLQRTCDSTLRAGKRRIGLRVQCAWAQRRRLWRTNPSSDCAWSKQVKTRRRTFQLRATLDDVPSPNKQPRALSEWPNMMWVINKSSPQPQGDVDWPGISVKWSPNCFWKLVVEKLRNSFPKLILLLASFQCPTSSKSKQDKFLVKSGKTWSFAKKISSSSQKGHVVAENWSITNMNFQLGLPDLVWFRDKFMFCVFLRKFGHFGRMSIFQDQMSFFQDQMPISLNGISFFVRIGYPFSRQNEKIWFLKTRWCERCLLITEIPKTPGHYRYLIWVLYYIP